MKRRLLRYALFALVVLSAGPVDGALAKSLLDPCDVAMGKNAPCAGAECAFDADTELEGSWQRVGTCIRGLRDAWSKNSPQAMVPAGDRKAPVADVVRNTIYRAMSQGGGGAALASDPGRYVPLEDVINPDLSFKQPVVRIAQLNDRGLPYTAMSQSGLARVLYSFARLAAEGGYPRAEADRDAYLKIANASIKTVLTPVTQGGLATTNACPGSPQRTCSWFHAITRKDRATDQGATLNKNLHAIRDLIIVKEVAEKNRWPVDPAIDRAIEAGLNQLFLSPGHTEAGRPPNMADFLASPGNGPSWAYYGFNPSAQPPKGGYFLKQEGRNCSYHDHVLDLMGTILKKTRDTDIAEEARSKALSCDSPLRKMYQARMELIPAPTTASAKTKPAQWCTKTLDKQVEKNTRFLAKAFSKCPQ